MGHGLLVAAGFLDGQTHINKFGYNSAVGTGFETVYDGSDIYSYIATPGVVTLTTVDADDDVGGNGARDVVIEGLDANFLEVSETLVTNGIGTTVGNQVFSRIFRMFVNDAGPSATNEGLITASVDSSVRASILATEGQTQMALYTIPANKTGYLLKFQGSVEKNQDVTFRIMMKTTGAFRILGQFGSFGSSVTYEYPVPLQIPSQTDVEIRAKAGATTGVGAIFDILLVDNG